MRAALSLAYRFVRRTFYSFCYLAVQVDWRCAYTDGLIHLVQAVKALCVETSFLLLFRLVHFLLFAFEIIVVMADFFSHENGQVG